MRKVTSKRSLLCRAFLAFLLLIAVSQGQDFQQQAKEEEELEKSQPIKLLKQKYNELPPGGKFATTAAAGFVTSRVAFKTFVSVAKVAGAALVV